MVPLKTCLADELLHQFALGLLSPAEAENVVRHLADCAACAQKLHQQYPEDSFVAALRGSRAVDPHDPSPEVAAQLVERLAGLAHVGTAVDTAPGSTPVDQPSADAPSPPTQDDYGFLTTPELPDEMGRLAGHRVLSVLGVGGMGIVFRAEDVRLQRTVALKVMRPALALNVTARQRFLREAQAAARVESDYIVPIYQVGEDQGVPFLAMPLLKGSSLEDRLKQAGRLTVDQTLHLGRQVALGLSAAHEHGLIHRDIKPANIWIEPEGGGRARLLDFGLARPAGDEPNLTQAGTIVGTPQYMAPEQARSEIVDARADLFSLGCVLYRACTGELPFKGSDTMSTLLSLAVDAPLPPAELNAEVPPALSELILRLLAKNRDDRPAAATEVVAALTTIDPSVRDAAEKRPGTDPARPPTTARNDRSRMWRWVAAAAGLLLTGAVLAGAVVIRITGKDGKVTQFKVPEGGVVEVDGQGGVNVRLPGSNAPFAPARPSPLDQLKADGVPAAERIAGQPQGIVAVLGSHAWRHPGPVAYVAFTGDGKQVASGGMEWGGYRHVLKIWDRATGREEVTLQEGYGGSFTNSYLVTPDGKTAVIAKMGSATVRDLPGGAARVPVSGDVNLGIFGSADGKQLWVSTVGYKPLVVRLLDVATGEETARIDRDDLVKGMDTALITNLDLVPTPDFSQVALRIVRKENEKTQKLVLGLVDVNTKKVRRLDHQDELSPGTKVRFTPDGKALATWDKTELRLWDVTDGKELRRLSFPDAQTVGTWVFSPDGQAVAAAVRNEIQLVEAASGKLLRTCIGHQERVFSLAFSADGKELVSGGECGTVRLWDVAAAKPMNPLAGHQVPAKAVAVSLDGSCVASQDEMAIFLWDGATGRPRTSIRAGSRFTACTFTADGKKLWVGCEDGSLRSFGAADGKELATLPSNGGRIAGLACSADGKWLAVAQGKAVRLVDAVTAQGTITLEMDPDAVESVCFARDGSRLAAGGSKGQIKVWQTASGDEVATFRQKDAPIRGLDFAPDGNRLAASDGVLRQAHGAYSGIKGEVRVWDIAAGKPVATYTEQTGWGWGSEITAAAFAPDGQSVYCSVAKVDRRVIQWLSPTQTREWQFPFPISTMTLASDGRHLLTANGDGTVYVVRLPAEQ